MDNSHIIRGTFEIEEVISEKKDFEAGSSASSNSFIELSHNAADRMSPNRTQPRLQLYRKVWQCIGWKSADVMTFDRASILEGFTSTILKQLELMFKFHRFSLSIK